MSTATREVMVAGYGTADDARLDYDSLSRLDSNHLMHDHGIVLVMRDAEGRVHYDETGGGVYGRLVAPHVQRLVAPHLEPGRASVVAILDTEPPLLDKATIHARTRALVPVSGRGRHALDTAIETAERDLAQAAIASDLTPERTVHALHVEDAERELAQRILHNIPWAVPLGIVFGAVLVLLASAISGIGFGSQVLMGAAFGVWAGLFFAAWAGFVAISPYLDDTNDTSSTRRR